jgi:hypothetical protein
MSGPLGWPAYYLLVGAFTLALVAAVALIATGQILAGALLALLAVLLWERMRFLNWMRRVTQRIEQRQMFEKVEVEAGVWGELCRAINGLLHEQHALRHRASLQPHSLPQSALAALLGGALPPSQHRDVAVIVIGLPMDDATADQIHNWRALQQLARAEAERYEALLLPCGLGVQLVFGAFDDRPLAESVRLAATVARAIADGYAAACHGLLAAGLASGDALTMHEPVAGFSVLGSVVEQALRLQQTAASSGEALLLCGERDYMRLYTEAMPRVHSWAPRPLQLAQGVYGVSLSA